MLENSDCLSLGPGRLRMGSGAARGHENKDQADTYIFHHSTANDSNHGFSEDVPSGADSENTCGFVGSVLFLLV